MPSFVHPALVWGLALAALPVAIHLLNRLRQKRVDWAAMEFLEASRRRTQRVVRLKELLLLAARVLAIVLLVMLVAQPTLDASWAGAWAGARVEYFVLLDDSLSMSDHWGDTSALAEARRAAVQIAQHASAQRGQQVFWLARFSQVAGQATARADLSQEPVDANLAARVEQALAKVEATALDLSPERALEGVARVLGKGAGRRRVLYLLSDFRRRQWLDGTALRKQLAAWSESGGEVHLVDCVDERHPNVAIASLTAQGGVHAARVPIVFEVAVTNFGAEPVRQVAVGIRDDGHARPAVAFDQIAPGKTESRRVALEFAEPGAHVVESHLVDDAVSFDNRRFATLDVAASVPVLVVSDDVSRDADFLSEALAPGGGATTGLAPRVVSAAELSTLSLDGFGTIVLANLPMVSQETVRALEQFVERGGGLVAFIGPLDDAEGIDARWRGDGTGLLPFALDKVVDLPRDAGEKRSDMQVENHPIFRIFAGERNSFLASVGITRYWALRAPAEWPREVAALARLRGGAPLMLERSMGKGKALFLMTTAGPRWNNWARNPSFVVSLLELQSYLLGLQHATTSYTTGSEVAWTVDRADFIPQFKVKSPRTRGEAVDVDGSTVSEGLRVSVPTTDQPGIYEVILTHAGGESETRRVAVNVSTEDGDLRRIEPRELTSALSGISFRFHPHGGFSQTERQIAGTSLQSGLFWVLLALLVGEQALAFAASYHAAPQPGRAR